jgi:hypothetical protein
MGSPEPRNISCRALPGGSGATAVLRRGSPEPRSLRFRAPPRLWPPEPHPFQGRVGERGGHLAKEPLQEIEPDP